MSSPLPRPKISPFIRALAWIVLISSVLGAAGTLYGIVTAKDAEETGVAWTSLALILLIAPLFGYTAIKGRAPRWFESVDRLLDEKATRQPPQKPGERANLVGLVVTAFIFGVTLIMLGRDLDIFEGETGWFAAGVFFLAWLTVVHMLWKDHKSRFRNKDDE